MDNAGNDGVGIKEFLEATEAKKGDELLTVVIEAQYSETMSALNALQPSSLFDAISNNTEQVKTAYAAAQNQVVLIKTDLPAALCVNITYIDNVDDGD